ncbi:MAG: hypothetical protein V4597_11475 [Pseudomonadota bacterium]
MSIGSVCGALQERQEYFFNGAPDRWSGQEGQDFLRRGGQFRGGATSGE